MPVSAAHATTRNTQRSTSTPTLGVGSRGPSVTRLQQRLRENGHAVGVDGRFGSRTASAVRAFQASRGLPADGRVGPRTWEALGTRAPDVGSSAGSTSNMGGAGPARNADRFEDAGGSIIGAGYQAGRRVGVRLTPVGGGRYLNARAAPSYKAMQEAARRDGVNLPLLSAFRSMEQQQRLYNLYRSGRGNKAARPGYSNHQMGLSVDLGNTGGYGGRNYRWLKQNAHRFGFVNDVRGEPWHWTYKR
jgi:peptidoglycan hydrolase-like protein with peptidoglycan-binding domain